MTQNILKYAEQSVETRKFAEDLSVNLNAASKGASLAGNVADVLSDIDTNARALDNISGGLNTVLKLVGKIGPMKAVTTPLKKAISAIEDRAEDVRAAAGRLESKFDKYGDAFDAAEATLATASKVMDTASDHLRNTESGLVDAATLIKNGYVPVYASAAIVSADAAAAQALAQRDQLKQAILELSPAASALNDLLGSIDGAGSLIIDANAALAKVIGKLEPISGPLEAIAKAVKPVEGFLDAADSVFNFFVSPILDPILEATGVNKLITNLVNGLNLPSLSPFTELENNIDAIGGSLLGSASDVLKIAEGVTAIAESAAQNTLQVVPTDGDDFILGHDGGNDAGSEISGLGGNDFLSGGKGNDVVDGGTGNDVVLGGAGNDRIEGGEGFDVASYGSKFGAVKVAHADGAITVNGGSAGLGTDILTGVERIVFNDGVLAFDVDQVAGQTYRLYQAAFDRTPDTGGLGHNIELMDAGLSLQDMASAFVNSAEFIQLYGTAPSDNAFIEALYNNVLDRGSDATGYAYWQHELESGNRSRADVLIGFSESTENHQNVAAAIDDGIWYT